MRHGIPNMGALQAFEATARLGSFSRAAEELSLTHSAVFRQVNGLEERLGVQLFTRIRRRIVLTEAGTQYAARVRHHLEQLEKDTLGLMSGAGMGRSLHVAVLPTLATTWLVPHLPEFKKIHNDIAVSLSIRTRPFQFNDHPFDAAIYHAPQMWPGTVGIKLFEEQELVPVCTPEMAAFIHSEPDALTRVTHLHMMSRPDAWREWYREQDRPYRPEVGAGPRYELFTMLLAAAQVGLGMALIPRFLVRGLAAAGQLVTPFPRGLSVRESYFFSYPAHAERSEALLAFEAWLQSIVRQDPFPDKV